jgi:predicted nuclease of predicted toxin-antitoxin system
MDEHVPWAITAGLRHRGVDVMTAQEDKREESEDEELLDRAGVLARVLFTQDQDFLAIAAGRLQAGVPFAGIIFAHQEGPSYGDCVRDLELMAGASKAEEYANRIEYLPLR